MLLVFLEEENGVAYSCIFTTFRCFLKRGGGMYMLKWKCWKMILKLCKIKMTFYNSIVCVMCVIKKKETWIDGSLYNNFFYKEHINEELRNGVYVV